MAHVSDFTQAPKKIVLDLVNEVNNTALTEALVEVAIHAQQDVTERNSRILLTALPGSGYSGEQALEYDRLQISGFTDLYYPGGMTIPLGDAASLVECIPEIEAGLGIKLTLDLDYEDQEITPWAGIPNETKLIQVPILPTSLVYLGELEFILDGNDIPLNSVITTTVLSGLNLPSGSGGGDNGAFFKTFNMISGYDEARGRYGFSEGIGANYGSMVVPGITYAIGDGDNTGPHTLLAMYWDENAKTVNIMYSRETTGDPIEPFLYFNSIANGVMFSIYEEGGADLFIYDGSGNGVMTTTIPNILTNPFPVGSVTVQIARS